ncbi:MAG: hypothetical protein ACO32I_09715, partial [Candidatus Limnocylindrus sp.]
HRHLNTLDDPDFARNRPDRLRTRRGLWDFVRIMGGLYGEQRHMLRFVTDTPPRDTAAANRPLVPRPLIYVVVVGTAALCGGLPLLLKYWLVPFGACDSRAPPNTSPSRTKRAVTRLAPSGPACSHGY